MHFLENPWILINTLLEFDQINNMDLISIVVVCCHLAIVHVTHTHKKIIVEVYLL